ncbi:MAG: ABC transporter ATP-binding protein [Candidatus Rokubacteria bacterium]|nr:ABC transporter ATP-binding protein [Candidatus Rokubacteria bacterium]
MLSVEGVQAGYDDILVLKDCSLEVRAGEFIALVGPNGAGKSTLLRAITGLLPVRAGAIRLDGDRIDGLPPYAIAARGLTMIPEGRRLFAPLTVRENLELGAFLRRAPGQQQETLHLIFRLFPVLREKALAPAGVLSGGEQQMLALARGLMARPRLLCLDDPFLGLSRLVTNRFCQAIREITAGGMTILAAGQHVRRLLRLAHRAYLLDEGHVVLSGPGPGLLEDERLRRTLLELIPEVDRPIG